MFCIFSEPQELSGLNGGVIGGVVGGVLIICDIHVFTDLIIETY
jgi:hypothetical protein